MAFAAFWSSGSREDFNGFYLIWAWRHLAHKTKKLVSKIRKYNNHKLQTNPLHYKEEPLNICSNKITVRQ